MRKTRVFLIKSKQLHDIDGRQLRFFYLQPSAIFTNAT